MSRLIVGKPTRWMTATVLAAACMAGLAGVVRAEDPKPAAPATQPAAVDPAAAALVKQLGDADPAVRDAAAAKLKAMGRAALPALRQGATSDDPEIKARSGKLADAAQKRVPAPAPQDAAFGQGHSVSVSVEDGVKTTIVEADGYRVRTRQDPNGITMDVTGAEDGKPVTETFKAKDAEELKRESPEAFALYEKYGANAGGNVQVFGGNLQLGGGNANVRIQVGGNGAGFAGGAGMVVGPGVVVVGPGGVNAGGGPNLPPEVAARMLEAKMRQLDQMIEARARMEENLNVQNLPPEQRIKMMEHFDRMIDQIQQSVTDLQRQVNPQPDAPKKEEPKKETEKK